MYRATLITVMTLLLLLPSAEAKEWFYYGLDSSHVELTLCDSLVTIRLDSTYGGGKATPLDLMVPGLQEGYVPMLQDLDYYQYGVVPDYDIDVLLADLRALDEVDYATPMFQLAETRIWRVYHEFLVSFREEVTQGEIASLVAANALEVLRIPLEWQWSYTFAQTEDSPEDVFDICNEIFESGLCYCAYPNLYGLPELCSTPNDTYYLRQWYLNHDETFPGKVDADIDMAEAWDYAVGNTSTTIAIIDYAFDIDHIDIDPSRFRYAIDVAGEYLRDRVPDFDPRIPETVFRTFPDYWHGTSLLGVIAAMTDNAEGVAGIADELTLMPIKCIDNFYSGNAESYGLAFQWAAYWMVDVIVCAVEFPKLYPDIEKAIDYGYKYGGTATIIAAGNKAKRPNALASLPTTLAVGATDYDDNIWERSNRGPGIELTAPGVGITTTDVTGSLGYNDFNRDADSCDIDLDYYCNFGSGAAAYASLTYQGTSAAAAQVAAVAGLVKARRPDRESAFTGAALRRLEILGRGSGSRFRSGGL